MCTCITYSSGDFYFGRNLDLEYSFGECVVITPRRFPLQYRHGKHCGDAHYAMIGMAASAGLEGPQAFPLYAEAVNEKGLCMAGLNFPGNAVYTTPEEEKENVASFEIIARILSSCASVDEADSLLDHMNITDTAFAPGLPPAPLHWLLADRERCIVIEQTKDGLNRYDNPFGVLTNNPPFEYHLMNMNNYLNLTPENPKMRFVREGKTVQSEDRPEVMPGDQTEAQPEVQDRREIRLAPYSQGMGAIGLPGDFSSASRFVRAAFLRCNSVSGPEEDANVAQFFHILSNVAMVRGAVVTAEGKYDITTYSCCVNADTGTYYYRTYDDSRLHCVRMDSADLDGDRLTAGGMA